MEDPKRILFPSPPIPSSSGINSRQKKKHFMSPTFSTASKFTTPKKRILRRWQDTDLDSQSAPHHTGTSNSFTNKHNNNDSETFVADSSTARYDPITNYLSPRPKFLRYNPNRKRKISPESSFYSESSCTPESSLKEEESVGNDKNLEGRNMEEDRSEYCSLENSLKNLEVQELEEQEEGEEVIEENNWGLKWELFKGLIVFIVLVLSTIYISRMNMTNPESRDPTSPSENFGNISFVSFSLRNFGLGIVGREELKCVSGIYQLGFNGVVDGLVEEPEIEDGEEDKGSSDNVLEGTGRELFCGGLSEPMVGNFEVVDVENVAFMAVDNSNLGNEGYSLVDTGDKMEDIELKLEDGKLANEVEYVVEDSFDEIEQEKEESKVLDFETKSIDGDVMHVVEVIAEGSFNGIEQEGDHECEMGYSEPNSKFVQSAIEPGNGTDLQIVGGYEGSIAEKSDTNVRLALKYFAWLVPLIVISFVACLVEKNYHKSKKGSSKTITKKKVTGVEKVVINSIGEGYEQIHPKTDSQLNVLPSIVVTEARDDREKTPPRIIPKVKQLGEIDFGREFSSITSTAVTSGKEANVCVDVDVYVRKTKRRKECSSTSQSHSHSSNITDEKTANKQKESKEETSILRRSRRLRSKGLASP